MATLSLQQAATKYGVPYQLLKKHAQRGKVAKTGTGVTDEAMVAYMAAEKVVAATESIGRAADLSGFRDFGNAIASLPSAVIDAILAGTPRFNKPGNPQAFRDLVDPGLEARVDKNPLVANAADPHYMYPIGFVFSSEPRWERVSETTWQLGEATYTYTGFGWEGGGTMVGQMLGDGVSPSHPDATRRPFGPKPSAQEISGGKRSGSRGRSAAVNDE